MIKTLRFFPSLAVLCLLSVAALLAGCNTVGLGPVGAIRPVIQPVAVDTQAMLAMVNAYRARRGKHPLVHDPRLDAVSSSMARHIAEKDSMQTWAHTPFGLSARLDEVGYENYAGAENLATGYKTLAATFKGWQESKDHNKNLLNPYVSRVGIARMARSDGKWRHFWVMTLSRPREDGRPVLQ